MSNEIINKMEKSARDIFRERALSAMESYRAGIITLEEVAELVSGLAMTEKRYALALAAMRKALANEGGDK